jgi:hypothetical protein
MEPPEFFSPPEIGGLRFISLIQDQRRTTILDITFCKSSIPKGK